MIGRNEVFEEWWNRWMSAVQRNPLESGYAPGPKRRAADPMAQKTQSADATPPKHLEAIKHA